MWRYLGAQSARPNGRTARFSPHRPPSHPVPKTRDQKPAGRPSAPWKALSAQARARRCRPRRRARSSSAAAPSRSWPLAVCSRVERRIERQHRGATGGAKGAEGGAKGAEGGAKGGANSTATGRHQATISLYLCSSKGLPGDIGRHTATLRRCLLSSGSRVRILPGAPAWPVQKPSRPSSAWRWGSNREPRACALVMSHATSKRPGMARTRWSLAA